MPQLPLFSSPVIYLMGKSKVGTNECWGTGKLRRMNAGEQEGTNECWGTGKVGTNECWGTER
jgi:hypothetical protein